jgi:hypothetical protein
LRFVNKLPNNQVTKSRVVIKTTRLEICLLINL